MTLTLLSIFAAALWSLNSYEAKVISVTDGDTVKVVVEVWASQSLTTAIRLRGVDTPEIKGKCAGERELAAKGKARVAGLLPAGTTVTLTQLGPDKYHGRHVAAIVLRDGTNVAALLIAEGLARPYDGGKKSSWC